MDPGLGLLVLGSVPVALSGIFLKSLFENAFESPLLVSGFLLVTALLLSAGERVRARRVLAQDSAPRENSERAWAWQGDCQGDVQREVAGVEATDVETGRDPEDPRGVDLGHLGVGRTLVVGVAQAFVLFPGLSRSGITITAGLFAGLTRPAATRFSFLLSLPALIGAGLVSLPDLGEEGVGYQSADIVIGVVAAFVAGYATVAWLVRLVARERLTVFVRYLVAVAMIGVFGYLMNGPLNSI